MCTWRPLDGSRICAGEGTRTLKLSRAPAPKAGAVANFATPARSEILPPALPAKAAVVPHALATW
jgi:hypothetical protein